MPILKEHFTVMAISKLVTIAGKPLSQVVIGMVAVWSLLAIEKLSFSTWKASNGLVVLRFQEVLPSKYDFEYFGYRLFSSKLKF